MTLWVMKMDPGIASWLAYSLLLRAARKLYPYYKMSFRPTVHTLPLANIHQVISWIDQNWNHAILVDHCPWQAQYPENLYYRTDILMKSVQTMSNLEDDIRSCPSWSAANKKECPKKNERIKSVMDHIKESAKKKQKRRERYFCKICQKFNHNTQDCWKNPKNQSNAIQGSADVGDVGEGEIGMA
jgi:hypothetical protein